MERDTVVEAAGTRSSVTSTRQRSAPRLAPGRRRDARHVALGRVFSADCRRLAERAADGASRDACGVGGARAARCGPRALPSSIDRRRRMARCRGHRAERDQRRILRYVLWGRERSAWDSDGHCQHSTFDGRRFSSHSSGRTAQPGAAPRFAGGLRRHRADRGSGRQRFPVSGGRHAIRWNAIRWEGKLALATVSLAVIGTALPFVLWFELLRRAPLTQLNGFSFLTPVFGLLIGALWFDERTSRLQIGGIALCLIGIYLLSRPPRAASPVRSGT